VLIFSSEILSELIGVRRLCAEFIGYAFTDRHVLLEHGQHQHAEVATLNFGWVRYTGRVVNKGVCKITQVFMIF
jgi:hypothetical protein